MVDKNPYEKDEVNVPDFSNQETSGNGPIFDMDTTSITSQTEAFDPMEEAESTSKTAIIVLAAFLILFLIGTISGWIFGITKSKEVANIQTEYESYKVKAQKQITDLETQISTLEATQNTPVVETTPNEATTTDTTGSAVYTIKQGQGVNVRPSAGATGDSYADYDKLKDGVKKVVSNNSGKLTIDVGQKVTVINTTVVGSQTWGQIDDAAWICLVNGADTYAEKN